MQAAAVLWDVGGVLVVLGEQTPGRDRWRERLALGPNELEERLWDAIGSRGAAATPAIVARLQTSCGLSAADAEQLLWEANDHWRVNEELVEFAQALHDGGVPACVVANAGPAARWAFEAIVNIAALADDVVISAEVGLEKPAAEIYLLACQRLGANPTECVFVDDIDANVAGAVAVGIAAARHVDNASTIATLTRALADR